MRKSSKKETKILVLGHAQHGKDTVAEYLAEKLNVPYTGASMIWAQMMYEHWGYASAEECYEDRDNHRPEWHQGIAMFCRADKARFGRTVYETNKIYCGTRKQDELDAVIAEFNPIVFYVDARKRKTLESEESYSIEIPRNAILLDNNYQGVDRLKNQIDAILNIRNI